MHNGYCKRKSDAGINNFSVLLVGLIRKIFIFDNNDRMIFINSSFFICCGYPLESLVRGFYGYASY